MEMTFDSIIENYNQRNEFLTKIWVWIAIMSIFGLIILTNDENLPEKIMVPLINIPVPAKYFITIYLLILTGMTIRWVDAFHRSVSFRQNIIEKLLKKNKKMSIGKTSVKSRSLIDGIVYSTTTSVWGIVPDFGKKNFMAPQLCIRFFVYSFLKIIIFVAHFLLPSFAIIIATLKLDSSSTPIILKIFGFITSVIGLSIILKTAYTELRIALISIRHQINSREFKK
jgi:hypothetical protein